MKLNHRLWKLFVIVALMGTIGCQTKSSEKREVRSNSQTQSTSFEWSDAWARPGSKGGNSAVYLKITNTTDRADTLLSISSSVAAKAALHESYQENGMSGMRPAGPQVIKPGSTLTLQPGSYHIMLMRLKQNLSTGDSVQVELNFSETGVRRLNVPVRLTK